MLEYAYFALLPNLTGSPESGLLGTGDPTGTTESYDQQQCGGVHHMKRTSSHAEDFQPSELI